MRYDITRTGQEEAMTLDDIFAFLDIIEHERHFSIAAADSALRRAHIFAARAAIPGRRTANRCRRKRKRHFYLHLLGSFCCRRRVSWRMLAMLATLLDEMMRLQLFRRCWL